MSGTSHVDRTTKTRSRHARLFGGARNLERQVQYGTFTRPFRSARGQRIARAERHSSVYLWISSSIRGMPFVRQLGYTMDWSRAFDGHGQLLLE